MKVMTIAAFKLIHAARVMENAAQSKAKTGGTKISKESHSA
jgi:hypothetical protein